MHTIGLFVFRMNPYFVLFVDRPQRGMRGWVVGVDDGERSVLTSGCGLLSLVRLGIILGEAQMIGRWGGWNRSFSEWNFFDIGVLSPVLLPLGSSPQALTTNRVLQMSRDWLITHLQALRAILLSGFTIHLEVVKFNCIASQIEFTGSVCMYVIGWFGLELPTLTRNWKLVIVFRIKSRSFKSNYNCNWLDLSGSP